MHLIDMYHEFRLHHGRELDKLRALAMSIIELAKSKEEVENGKEA